MKSTKKSQERQLKQNSNVHDSHDEQCCNWLANMMTSQWNKANGCSSSSESMMDKQHILSNQITNFDKWYQRQPNEEESFLTGEQDERQQQQTNILPLGHSNKLNKSCETPATTTNKYYQFNSGREIQYRRLNSSYANIPFLFIFILTLSYYPITLEATDGDGGNSQVVVEAAKLQPSQVNSEPSGQIQWSQQVFSTNHQQPPTASLVKKTSPMDHISSADLKAEFRDEESDVDGNRNEQSKLAKLCQQTSSVLASVLPAPFGGHKRSVLCQFFGQIPFSLGSKKQQTQPAKSQQPTFGADSFAVLHQNQVKPIAFMTEGKHPIQIVLEQQQRQLATQSQLQQQPTFFQPSLGAQQSINRFVVQNEGPSQDLKGSASVIDYAYHQKLEPPNSMRKPEVKSTLQRVKFSAPVSATSFKPITKAPPLSPQATSLGGWRIFDNSLENDAPSAQPVDTVSTPRKNSSQLITTTPSSVTNKTIVRSQTTTASNSSTISFTNKMTLDQKKQANISAQALLVLGKPPGFNQQRAVYSTTGQPIIQVSIAKRSEALKSTTQSMESSSSSSSLPVSDVRTIEVNAQSNNSSSLINEPGKKISPNSNSTTTSTTSKPDLGQVQKREELVIASINNLTRIAFGNHLRDTVKVINKLIDQQSNLFNVNNKHVAVSNISSSDQMLTSESQLIADGVKSKNKISPQKTTGALIDKARQKQILTSRPIKDVNIKSMDNQPKKQPTIESTYNRTASTSRRSLFNQKLSTTFSARDARTTSTTLKPTPVERKWIASPRGELLVARSRATSVNNQATSRSLSFDAPRKAVTPVMSDYDPLNMAATMAELQRDSSKTSWPIPSKLTLKQVTSKPTISGALRYTPKGITRAPLVEASSSKYPWLIANDRNTYHYTDMFGSVTVPWDKRTNSIDAFSKWSNAVDSRKLTTLRLPATSKKALVLNRLDNGKADKLKMDSLTTLKMSLAAGEDKKSTIADSGNLIQRTFPTTQTRWIPTSVVSSTTPTPSSPQTTFATTTTTTKESTVQSVNIPTTTTTPRITTLNPNREEHTTKSTEQTDTPVYMKKSSTKSLSMSDLNELRASDSISKYTTHLNEANELFATTRRFQQQTFPEIAKTGEFFNAETIASWPEKYQTMIEGSGSFRTTPTFETTRRNGETFETTFPRHRAKSDVEKESTRTTRSDFPAISTVSLENFPSITILPANHKLLTNDDDRHEKSVEQFKTSYFEALPTSTAGEINPTTKPVSMQTSGSYTLVGPHTSSDLVDHTVSDNYSNSATTTSLKFPHVVGDSLPTGEINIAPDSSNQNLTSVGISNLRPPYLDLHDESNLNLGESSLDKPLVTRKLYELLVPSTRSFVGSQNPLNIQRFNLSALKFLVQSLLAANDNQTNETSNENVTQSNNNPNNTQQRLLEMLNISLPSSYYDIMDLNQTSASQAQGNKPSTSNKSIFTRASNLLTDLKQLEQKKAAAILAAIRYQVPSPLVRPWDLASDIYSQSRNDFIQMDDRFDDLSFNNPSNVIKENFLLAQITNAIRSVLNRQRVIPRAELEARLNSKPANVDAEIERRADSLQKATSEESSFPEDDQRYGKAIDAHIFANDKPHKSGILGGRNLTKALLEELIRGRRMRDVLTAKDKESTLTEDFDLIDLTALPSSGKHFYHEKVEPATEIDVRRSSDATKLRTDDKYLVSFSDSGTKLDRDYLLRLNNSSQVDHKHRSKNALKLQSSTESTNMNHSGNKDSDSFDCSNHQAGFYPDVETACQTFYHCSNTGHLLTFNCPQQTRFDEKSLKCGPWFEVPCDLGRNKHRRYS